MASRLVPTRGTPSSAGMFVTLRDNPYLCCAPLPMPRTPGSATLVETACRLDRQRIEATNPKGSPSLWAQAISQARRR